MLPLRGVRGRRALLFLTLGAGSVLFPAPFALLLPGLAILLLEGEARPYSLAPVLSLAFWPVALQVLYGIRLPARIPVTILLVGAAAVVAWRGRLPERAAGGGILAAAVLFRLLPALIFPCASGIDMSLHTFLARKIAEEGVPPTFAPVSGDPVPGIPLGFHLAMASLGLELNSAALWMSVLPYAILTLSLYRGLSAFWRPCAASWAAVLVSFLASKPQSAVRYGSNPLVLGFALVVAAAAVWAEGLRGRLKPLSLALLAAGGAVVHPSPAYGAVILMGPAAVAAAVRRFTREQWIRAGVAAGLSAVMALPTIVAAAGRPLSAGTIHWVRAYLTKTCAEFSGAAGWDWLRAFWVWIYHEMGPQFTIVGLLAALYGLWRRRLLAAFLGLVLLGLAGIALNLRLWILPGSVLAYPDRAIYFLIIPVGGLLAAALEEAGERGAGRRGYRAGWVAAGILAAAVAGLKGYSRYLAVYRSGVVVSAGDFEAMDWIRRNTGPGEVFLNLPGDSGMWIPAFADRPITDPHGPPIYFSRPVFPSPPRYLYVGKGVAQGNSEAVLARCGGGGRAKVFERGAVVIYRLP